MESAIACTEPPNACTAHMFCCFIRYLAGNALSPGCEVIAAAGGIPVLVEQLAQWPDDKKVAEEACAALSRLMEYGSDGVRDAVRRVPGVSAVLRKASARLQAWGMDDIGRDCAVLAMMCLQTEE